MAATVAAGIALANPASAVAPTSASVSVAPKGASAIVGQTKTLTVTAKNSSGALVAAGTTVWVSLSQAPAAGQANGPNLTLDGTTTAGTNDGGSPAKAVTTNVPAKAETTVGTTGQATFTVASSQAGTVNINVAADNGAGAPSTSVVDSTTLTEVASVGSANANVAKLSASATNNAGYAADATPANFTVTATNSAGVPAIGATVSYSVTTGSTTTGPTDFATTTDSNGQVVIPLTAANLNAAGGGSGTVNFWVNNATSGGTPLADPGEPTASAPFNLTQNPAATTSAINTAHAFGTSLPAGAQNVAVTFKVTNGAAPVVGAHVAVDANVPSTAPTATRYAAITDADGNAVVSIPVTAAQGANGGSIKVTGYFSESAAPAAGLLLPVTNTATYTFANPVPTTVTDGGITAVDNQPGGTVSIPVTVTDQFGNPAGVGTNVFYNVTSSNGNAANGKTAVIDSNGVANVTYTDVSGQTDATKLTSETVTITSAAGLTAGLPGPITVSYVASTAPGKIAVSTQPATTTIAASGSANQNVVFQVYKADGTTAASGGVPVTVSVNQGFIGLSNTVSSTAGMSVSTRTDNNGKVSVWVGSKAAGTQTVTAKAGAQSVSANAITYTALAPYAVTLTGPTAVPAGGAAKFTAKVADALGNGIAGQSVTFTATDSSVLPGSVSPLTVTTGPDGTVTVTITAGSADGSITATDAAVTGAGTTNSATAKYTVNAVHFIAVDGANGAKPGTPEKVAVHVYPAAATTVTVTVSGANSATGTVTTDATGRGSFYYTPSAVGVDKAVASVGTVSNTTTIYVSNTRFIAIAGASGAAAGRTERVAVHVYPAAVVAVQVRVSGANSASGTVITDASGRANFYYTPRSGGVDRAAAYVGSVHNSATINVTGVRFIAVAGAYGAQTSHTERVAVHVYPSQSIAVVVHVSGSNFASGTVRTNASGVGNFYYTPRKAGTDKAVVSAGGVNNVATIRVR